MNPFVARDYIENCLKIKTKTGEIMPFKLNPAQEKLYRIAKEQQDAGKPVRLIILKARQLGFSTLTEGLIFHACATKKNRNALIVAHREDSTGNLFRMSKLFYELLPAPAKPMLKASNAQELIFENPTKSQKEKDRNPGLRSRIRCATAGGKGIGRSDTLHCVHLSEYAFWPEGPDGKRSTLIGILQAVPALPGTMVVIESTANGFDDFKTQWDVATSGGSDFRAVFFAWFENPDYTMEPVPGTEWDDEERDLQERYGLTEGQLQWRRWCIANNCGGDVRMFRQEYPSNPDEAFLHSGTGVFDNELVIRTKETLEEPVKKGRFLWEGNTAEEPAWKDENPGVVKIYEEPIPGHPYVVGADTAGDGSDSFTAWVIDNSTGERVAMLKQKYSEREFVWQIYSLGKYYNDALLGIEINFSTYAVMRLDELGYTNQYIREREDTYTKQLKKSFGWKTDKMTRPRIIANLEAEFAAHPEWFRDEDLLNEMLTFVYNEDHRPEAMAGEHDDMVMAAAICHAVRHQQRMNLPEAPEVRPEKLITKMQRQNRVRRRF